jgi:hypothetical protein
MGQGIGNTVTCLVHCLVLSIFAKGSGNKMVPRLIHNRPGPVCCENAWDRYATSQQRLRIEDDHEDD